MTKKTQNVNPPLTIETSDVDRSVGPFSTDGSVELNPRTESAAIRGTRGLPVSPPKYEQKAPRDGREMLPTLDDSRHRNDADEALRHVPLRALVDEHAPGAWETGRVTLEGDSVTVAWPTVAITASPTGVEWRLTSHLDGAVSSSGVDPEAPRLWSAVRRASPLPLLRARVRSGIREYARGSEWVSLPAHGDLRPEWELLPGELALTLEQARTPDPESDAVMRADARALACARDLADALAVPTSLEESEATARLVDRCLARWQRALVAADRAAAPR